MEKRSRYRGCLVGGAAGDALGYAVEFMSDAAIFRKFGEKGITEYELMKGAAQISDDTQMTLFTANGLLLGKARGMTRGVMGAYPSYIHHCYLDWLDTQRNSYDKNVKHISWLCNLPQLYEPRAPGMTCLNAMDSGEIGSTAQPINKSKGCGGVMRVAPIGLFFGELPIAEVDKIGAETAALTHGHELGWLPAAALVHIIHRLVHQEMELQTAVISVTRTLPELYPNAEHLPELLKLIERAVWLSGAGWDDLDAIHDLGEGWVAEETLAIAIYCALKYKNDFDSAIIAAVNHNGDSDSTGAVTGNILGAALGMEGIPEKYLRSLELKDVILEMADDLYAVYREDGIWADKYVRGTYRPKSE